jgi:nucleotide-binding universal stress UspA family protein
MSNTDKQHITQLAPAKTVVVGVDGSEGSFEALLWAAHHAHRAEVPLKIVTVTEIPAVYTAAGLPAMPVGSTFEDLVEHGMDVNARAVDDARAMDLGIDISGVSFVGTPILNLVEQTEFGDVLVVAAGSHTGRLSDLLGTVATGVVHRAHGPVVIVHGTIGHDAPMRRIVVGVDGWDESTLALRWACALAEFADATIDIVHGWEYPYHAKDVLGSPRAAMQQDAIDLIDGVVKELDEHERRLIAGTHIVEGAPAEVLIDASKDADLLVVGSRGRGGLRSLLLGSVSRKAAHHAACAVAVVPSSRANHST